MTETANRLRALVACLAVLAGLTGTHAVAQGGECAGYDRDIVFAELDWDSPQFHEAVAQYILEEGYGCSTTAIPGSAVPMYQAMIRGDIDVIMEVWLDQVPDFWVEAIEEGTAVQLGINYDDAVQGFYVPRYVIEGDPERGIEPVAPDLESVFDLPQYADVFRDPEQPNMGRFYNGVIGWQLEVVNNVKLEAYDLTEHFTNFRPGTAVALNSSLQGAYLRGEPWLGYQWEPTWVLGELDMVRLEEPEYSEACWEHINANIDTPEDAQEACAYPQSVIAIAASEEFVQNAPQEVLEFLGNYRTSSAITSAQLAYMQETESSAQEAARNFLSNEQDVWTQWVPDEVAERVIDSLN
mgnify:FL=1